MAKLKIIIVTLGLFNVLVYGTMAILFAQKVPDPQALEPEVKEIQTLVKGQSAVRAGAIPATAPASKPMKLSKKSYTLAFFGDSMIDTLGADLAIVAGAMEEKYPGTVFKLYNYGMGGENISRGLARFDKGFANYERDYPAITTISPDVLVLGTFAYNPFSPHDPDRYRREYADLIDRAVKITAKPYVLLEIAPLKKGFGRGPKGVNWGEDVAYVHTLNIIGQIEIARDLARQRGLPVIDVYSASLDGPSFADPKYVNATDGIHPSEMGRELMAGKIAESLGLK